MIRFSESMFSCHNSITLYYKLCSTIVLPHASAISLATHTTNMSFLIMAQTESTYLLFTAIVGRSLVPKSTNQNKPLQPHAKPHTITRRPTASEPNMLKLRLKQSVIDRKARNGPAAVRRHERIVQAAQRRQQLQQQKSAQHSTQPQQPTQLNELLQHLQQQQQQQLRLSNSGTSLPKSLVGSIVGSSNGSSK